VKWILLALFSSSLGFSSDLTKAPNKFKFEKKDAVYSDFQRVHSEIQFQLDGQMANVISTVEFMTKEDGYPIFDLVPEILSAEINGEQITVNTIKSPRKETTYKYINKRLPAGHHKLVLHSRIKKSLQFNNSYVNFATWMSDLSDRQYIEQYLPSNLEFDQYQLTLDINLKSSTKISEHILYTNGEIISEKENQYSIVFPKYFTASSFYLHLTKKGRFPTENFIFNSISGKSIPVTLYGKSKWSISGVQSKIKSILKELEMNFGAWSHPTLTVYIAGLGGMEHSGATVTSESALGHELTHSYFARGVMPINGNAGWMDEAIASWRDSGYKSVNSPNFSSTSMSSHSQYRRYTDRKAYKQGANFMAYLNNRLSNHGGLKVFLNQLHGHYTHHNISTNLFKKELENFSGENFTKEFNRYIFGNKGLKDDFQNEKNPHHPQLTEKQLLSIL